MKCYRHLEKLVIVLSVFLINIKSSYAFFSPSTLQLISASVGPVLRQVLVATITAIVAFGIRIRKKRTKRLILAICSIILMIVLIISGVRFNTLKKLNNQVLTLDDLKRFDSDNFPDYFEVDKNYMATKFIDLNNIDEKTYAEFKVISLELYSEDEFRLRNSIYISFSELWDILRGKGEVGVEEYAFSLNITKDDKILVICHHGAMSSVASYFFNKGGYEAYYSSWVSIDNERFIDGSLLKQANKENYVLIDKFSPEKSDQNYIIFDFDTDEAHYLCNENLFLTFSPHYHIIKDNIVAVEASRFGRKHFLEECDIAYSDFYQVYEVNSKIICLYPLHCLLTQHHLYYLNLTRNIKRIYRVGGLEGYNFNALSWW